MSKLGKRGQEPIAKWPEGRFALLVPDPFSQALKLTLMMTVVCGWSSIATAQFSGGNNPQGNSPTISPYINLLRGGNVGLNYYGLVRPQQDFAMQNQQLGQGIQSLQMLQGSQMQMSSRGDGYSQLGMTGHPVIFNSFGNGQFTGGYTGFGNSGGGFGGGFSGGNFGGGGQFGGQSNFGSQANFGGIGTTGGGFGSVSSGFSGASGHMSQFGGIGNTYRLGR